MAAKGEAATLRLARSILSAYEESTPEGRIEFFRYLANDLDIDAGRVSELAQAYQEDASVETLHALLDAGEPQRQTFFRKLNQAEGATTRLVAMRRHLLAAIKEHPDLARIDLDLVHLFSSWFNRGFLVLQRIDWATPADLLEKIIAYEAVHQINDWDDLRGRTQPPDRRCYAYMHPQVPDDPLIFVEIALTQGIPQSIQSVLAPDRMPMDPDEVDTAIFYSISNCQQGLHGISFGESLIKQVVADLSRDLPHLKHFVTLSPIPGFRRWLENSDRIGVKHRETLLPPDDAPLGEEHAETLRALAAVYLSAEKRKDGLPRDPVARFHLSNGAEIHDVLPGADISENGQRNSLGVMVNYRYNLPEVEKNSEAFATDQSVPISRKVLQAAKAGEGQLLPLVDA